MVTEIKKIKKVAERGKGCSTQWHGYRGYRPLKVCVFTCQGTHAYHCVDLCLCAFGYDMVAYICHLWLFVVVHAHHLFLLGCQFNMWVFPSGICSKEYTKDFCRPLSPWSRRWMVAGVMWATASTVHRWWLNHRACVGCVRSKLCCCAA